MAIPSEESMDVHSVMGRLRSARLVTLLSFAAAFGTVHSAETPSGTPRAASFAPEVTIPIVKRAHHVNGADLNRDGYIDLIVAAAGANQIAVLLGQADGSLAEPRYFPSGAAPKATSIGDFNQDGLVDIAVAEQDSNSVGILLGRGDGSFGERVGYDSCRGDHEVVVADFNGDGKDDVAAACWGGDIASVFFGVGDGTLLPRVDLKAGGRIHSTTAADLNGDGRTDLLVANGSTDYISLFESTPDGGFLPEKQLTVGAAPHSVRVADVDGDGYLDVLAANNDGNSISVLWGKAGGGFDPRTDLPAVSAPVTVAAADINGDGILDLLTVNTHKPGCCSPAGSMLRVYVGKGERSFLDPADFFVGSQPFSIYVHDINRDGRMDVATASYMSPPAWLRNTPAISAVFDSDYGSRWFKRFRLAGLVGFGVLVAAAVAWRSRRILPGVITAVVLVALYMGLRIWITGLKDPSHITLLLGS